MALTTEGIEILRQPDVQKLIEDDLKAQFQNIDLSAESINGQLVGVYTKPPTDIYELAEMVYLSFSPQNAEGVSLDYLVALNGLTRLGEEPSEVVCGIKGNTGTVVTLGFQVSSESIQDLFEITTETIITNLNQSTMFVTIDNHIDFTNYDLDVGGTNYQYPSLFGGNVDVTAQNLIDQINADLTSVAVATKLPNGTIKLVAKTINFDTIVDSNMSYYTPSVFLSVENGPILVNALDVNTIETPITGVTSVVNFEAGDVGRLTESDSELRIRRDQSLQIAGAGTLPSMVARILQDVDGVDSVKGFENRTDTTDGDGRPRRSFELVVVGGTDLDIANKIWQIKPAGMKTYGNVNGGTGIDITDDNGDIQTMFFSRPVNQYIWMDISITLYSEEDFPIDGLTQVEQKAFEYGVTTQIIGLDVISQRFYGSIFEVPGIETIDITLGVTALSGDPKPTMIANNPIPITDSQISVFELVKITATQI